MGFKIRLNKTLFIFAQNKIKTNLAEQILRHLSLFIATDAPKNCAKNATKVISYVLKLLLSVVLYLLFTQNSNKVRAAFHASWITSR